MSSALTFFSSAGQNLKKNIHNIAKKKPGRDQMGSSDEELDDDEVLIVTQTSDMPLKLVGSGSIQGT